MIRGIHHTAISPPDIERFLALHRDVLGLRVVFDFSWPTGTEVAERITGLRNSAASAVMLRAGNALIELFQSERRVQARRKE